MNVRDAGVRIILFPVHITTDFSSILFSPFHSSFLHATPKLLCVVTTHELLQRLSIWSPFFLPFSLSSFSFGCSCYPPLIRVQSATDDSRLRRRAFSGNPARRCVQPLHSLAPKLSRGSLSSPSFPPSSHTRILDPPSVDELASQSQHDVCGLNYSGGSTRDPSLDHVLKDPLVLSQSLPRRHRLRRRRRIQPEGPQIGRAHV